MKKWWPVLVVVVVVIVIIGAFMPKFLVNGPDTPTPGPDEKIFDPDEFVVQPSGPDKEFFLGLNERPDLRGYILEFKFQGEGNKAQLFFKNCPDYENVYAFEKKITNGQSIRFDPEVDPRKVDEFQDFSSICAIGAKIFGEIEGVNITSAKLIKKQ